MMGNDSFPTTEEQSAILAWAEQRQKCHDFIVQQRGPHPPHVDAFSRSNSQLMAALYKGGFIRRYLSGLEHWFETGGQSAAAAVSMRMRTLCVASKVLDSAHEGRA